MIRFACLISFCLVLGAVTVILAQDDCPVLVENALTIAQESCSATERNTACYGNKTLIITPRPNVRVAEFASPGDVAPLAALEKLELGNQIDQEEWGIALLQVQANLPDTTPGQNVTMLLFGSVSVENAVDPDAELPAATLEAEATAEPETLPYTPMQAFYFSTGIGDRPCVEAPDSGILVQTPEGAADITLTANGVDIDLGSTVYLESGSGSLRVKVLEGSVRVTANGITRVVPAGALVEVPLTPDGRSPAGAPTVPQAYDDIPLQSLPLRLLPQIISIAPPAQDTPDTNASYQAVYSFVLEDVCPDWTDIQPLWEYDTAMTFTDDGAVMDLGGFIFTRAGDGLYTRHETFGEPDNQSVWDYTLRFSAPGTFEGEIVATWNFSTCVPRYVISGMYATGE